MTRQHVSLLVANEYYSCFYSLTTWPRRVDGNNSLDDTSRRTDDIDAWVVGLRGRLVF